MTATTQGAIPQFAQKAAQLRRLPAPAMRRALRTTAGLSLTDIAVHIGVSRQAVSHWERGTRTPTGRHLDLYVDVLTSLDSLGVAS